jgi:hypothetical protein
MNDLYHQPKIPAHPAVTWLLLGLMVLFALNSYPMMYPGYDVWTHLEGIRNPGMHINKSWHQIWHSTINFVGIDESKLHLRGLIVHRFQVALTIMLLASSAYIFINISIKNLGKHLKIQLSLIAVAIWLIMHGTYSSPLSEPHDSARHVLSWLQWYSVNYQIALPMFFFASAAMLKAVTAKVPSQTVWWSVITLITAYLIARIHAAELVYFLFVAGGIVLIYVLPNTRWWAMLLAVVVLIVALKLGLMFSYRQPVLLELLHPSRWSELVARMNEFGHLLVGSNLNRSETTWHSLYSVSLLAAVASVFMVKDKDALRLALLLIYSSTLAIGWFRFTCAHACRATAQALWLRHG